MSAFQTFIKGTFSKFPLDKLTHFGFGGLICGFFTILALCGESLPTCEASVWRFVFCWAFGAVIAVLLGVVKELCDRWTTGWDWHDLLATFIGTLPILIASALGFVLYVNGLRDALIRIFIK